MVDAVLERIMIEKNEVNKVEAAIRFHEHLRRYASVRRFCYGRVLDFASGCGYGSHILSCNPDIDVVVGVDRDKSAIDWAIKEFSTSKSVYKCIDIEEVSEKFDTLVCLETIEHFEDKSLIPRLANRCAIDNLIISFPNKKSTHFNPFHVYDYNSQMIVDLLPDYICYKSFCLGDVQFLLFIVKPIKAPFAIFQNILNYT